MAAAWLIAASALASPSPLHAGPALATAIRLVERNYLFADELDPHRLLGEAFEHTESAVPELNVRRAGQRGYLLTAGYCRLYLEPVPGQELTSILGPLESAADLIERCTPARGEDDPPLDSVLLSGLLRGLDPYSTILDAKRRTEHRIQFKGQLAGIGARIGIREERLVLIRVYEHAPAFKAGLRDGDVVLRIDGLSATNIRVNDAVERIRGRPGTQVRLTVEREAESEATTITVTRAVVRIPSVEARLLESGVVYAEISHFSQTTPTDFRERVAELTAGRDTVAGVIIDLRRNSGGSMLGSSAIGDLFLENGLLISTAGRSGRPVAGLTARVEASPDTPFAKIPIALLTSARTASGSELLAASLRNHGRAILVGERTFGKGTVQKTYSLGAGSALKITVGSFLPNRRPIPGGGLTPDVEFRRYRLSDTGAAVPSEPEADLPFWLRTPSWFEEDHHEAVTIIELVDQTEKDSKVQADPVLDLAEALLAEHGSTSAAAMLESAGPSLERSAVEAVENLSAILGGKNIDWTAAPAAVTHKTPALEASLHVEGGRVLTGRDNKITVRIANKGKRPLSRLKGVLDSETWMLDGRGMLFGRIEPGQHRDWTFEVQVPARLRPGRLQTKLALSDAGGPVAELGPFYLALEASPRPHLAHRVAIDRDGDISTVRVEVENRGPGEAEKVKTYLKNPLTSDIELLDPAADIESLGPGQAASRSFRVRTLTTNVEEPEVTLVVSEGTTFSASELRVALLAGSGAFGAWREAPRLAVQAVAKNGHVFGLLARASDDSGIVSLVASVDGDQRGYLTSDGTRGREVSVLLPWTPADGTKQIELVATDRDGLVTSYIADL